MKNWMSKLLGLMLVLALLTSAAFGAVAEAIPADGVYESSANGLGGELKVAVTVAGGKITEVKVGDVMEIRFGEKMAKYRILAVAETVRKADAGAMYELIEGDDDL